MAEPEWMQEVRALVGKEEGDVVTVQTPSGRVEYEIVEVRHI